MIPRFHSANQQNTPHSAYSSLYKWVGEGEPVIPEPLPKHGGDRTGEQGSNRTLSKRGETAEYLTRLRSMAQTSMEELIISSPPIKAALTQNISHAADKVPQLVGEPSDAPEATPEVSPINWGRS